mgnify:CR=1 FL=1
MVTSHDIGYPMALRCCARSSLNSCVVKYSVWFCLRCIARGLYQFIGILDGFPIQSSQAMFSVFHYTYWQVYNVVSQTMILCIQISYGFDYFQSS